MNKDNQLIYEAYSKKLTKEQEEFLNKVVKGKWKQTNDGIDVDGSVSMNCSDWSHMSHIPVKFNYVSGYFSCCYCKSLISLEGSPNEVGSYFDCSCTSLTSLKDAPNKVDGDFNCYGCNSLISLEGAPNYVGGYFDCRNCSKLTSLKDAPNKVDGYFDCSDCESLESLKGAPDYVGKSFSCTYCNSLTSLEGAPNYVGGYFRCSYCKSLISLKGAPEKLRSGFNFSFTKVKNLNGLPTAKSYRFKNTKFTQEDIDRYLKLKDQLDDDDLELTMNL